MNIPDAPDGSSLWTLGAGALASLMYLRKYISRQNVEINKDSAESNLIKTLQEERDKALAAAHEAWKTKAEDAKLIGELTSEVRALRETVMQLKAEVDSFRLGLQGGAA